MEDTLNKLKQYARGHDFVLKSGTRLDRHLTSWVVHNFEDWTLYDGPGTAFWSARSEIYKYAVITTNDHLHLSSKKPMQVEGEWYFSTTGEYERIFYVSNWPKEVLFERDYSRLVVTSNDVLTYVEIKRAIRALSAELEGHQLLRFNPCTGWGNCSFSQLDLKRDEYKIFERVKPTIDWDSVAEKWKFLFLSKNGLGILSPHQPSIIDGEWTGAGEQRLADSFASYQPGNCEPLHSLVTRPLKG